MMETFSSLGAQSIWLTVLIGAIIYACLVFGFRSFLKPVLVNALDPMNIQLLLFVAPGLLGLFLLPYLTGTYTYSFLLILIFLGFLMLVIRCSGKPRRPNLTDKMGTEFSKCLLVLSIAMVALNVVINMVIPGTIPLFTEGGVYSRFDATQNSRLLYWASLGLSPMPGLVYALTQNQSVRRLAIAAVFVGAASGLLFANKGAVLTIPFVILNAMFVCKIRNEMERFRTLRKILLYCTLLVIGITPIYLRFIGFGTGGSLLMPLATRLLGGFDQLMFTSQLDLLNGGGSAAPLHINLIEYQSMAFFKAILSRHYEYSSVGQYVIEAVTGNVVEATGTLPNSNLILEAVFTSGKYLGLSLFILECGMFYWGRRIVIAKPVTPFWLVASYITVFQPFGLFISGQEWVTEAAVVAVTVAAACFVSAAWIFVKNALMLITAASERQIANPQS